MNQKNHSRNNVRLQDYKYANSGNQRSDTKTLANSSNNPGVVFLIIAVFSMLGAGGYYIFQNSSIVADLLAKQEQLSVEVLTDKQTDVEFLDVDLLKRIDIVEESQSTPDITEPESAETVAEELIEESENTKENWTSVTVKKGDSLSRIFARLNLSHKDAMSLASSETTKALNRLIVGQNLEIKIDAEHKFAGLKYQVNQLKSMMISKNTDGEFITETHEVEPTIRIRDVTGAIQDSLFNTAEKLGISDRIISKLSNIFLWDIDFARDIRNGDRFSVIFEEKYVDGEVIGSGEILAAEFIINGHSIRAIRHEDKDGIAHYFTPEGKSLKKAFMRNPLKFVNITSGFTHRRFHPKLKRWRAHKGVDYGAPKGTPIMTTADGVIEHLGRRNAYGKTIVINHGQGYSTLYAHMSGYNKNLKKGSRVKQGQIIGYVGRTGLATGNHLHYEFRINGKHVNPLAVKLPRSLPIDSKELNEFIAQSEKWVRRLDALQGQSVADINSQILIPPSI